MNEQEYIAAETERLLHGRVRLCACDCGKPTKKARNGKWNLFLRGHNSRFQRLQKMFPAEMHIYRTAKQRCTNPKSDGFANYGGRGIKFLFTSFEHFWLNLGARPSQYYSLERNDSNGNYEPSNCHWATKSEQSLNRRHHNQYDFEKVEFYEPLY